jgi:hypothetical protein
VCLIMQASRPLEPPDMKVWAWCEDAFISGGSNGREACIMGQTAAVTIKHQIQAES